MMSQRALILVAFAIALAGAFMVAGGPAAAVIALAMLLWLAWRYDNHTGSLFMAAVLFTLVVLVLVGLLALIALER